MFHPIDSKVPFTIDKKLTLLIREESYSHQTTESLKPGEYIYFVYEIAVLSDLPTNLYLFQYLFDIPP